MRSKGAISEPKIPGSFHKSELTITYHSTDSLKLNEQNPRRHSKKQIRKIASSIEAFGFVVPVIIDSSLQVIAGHGRVLAARLLGISAIPTISLQYMSETQIRAFMIADNKLTELGNWDHRLLAQQFQTLSEVDLVFTLESTGFDLHEIELLIGGVSPLDGDKSDVADKLPPPSQVCVSKAGDCWLLDKHRILCGDPLVQCSYETSDGWTTCDNDLHRTTFQRLY